MHWDGQHWTRVAIAGVGDKRPTLRAIAAVAADRVWVAGDNVLLGLAKEDGRAPRAHFIVPGGSSPACSESSAAAAVQATKRRPIDPVSEDAGGADQSVPDVVEVDANDAGSDANHR